MNILYIYIISAIITFVILFNLFLIFFDDKLKLLEKQIISLFEKRTNLIPSLYEISKKYLTKHDEVFSQVMKLRKAEFWNYDESFLFKINNEILIHHELNFIFKVINKHPKIQKDEKFLLIRDLFLEVSDEIWKKIDIYKKMMVKLNKLLRFKNLTIIWLFINIKKRTQI